MDKIKPIPGFPGYFADIQGNIWSGWGNGGRRRINTGIPTKKLKPSENTNGNYLFVNLYREKKKYIRRVHRLILETFVGPRPENMQCCHEDGIKLNVALSNLRWDTKSSNEKDKIVHGTSNRGAGNGRARLTEEEVIEIKRLLESGEISQIELTKLFNTTDTAISNINVGRTWSHIE